MSYPCTVREGEKWCGGPCGRPLPATSFYLNGRGYTKSTCKECERVAARARYRRRYRKATFRQAERARKRAAYRGLA